VNPFERCAEIAHELAKDAESQSVRGAAWWIRQVEARIRALEQEEAAHGR
jgi:hypothetical protein